ncbi:MAG TPA: hypothetical protein PLD20_28640, partial [Blastocatellia bacterium]|nr:hypothetical protein [Blastocatellia bacterium]
MLKFERRIALLICAVALCLAGLVWGRMMTVSADTTAIICGTVSAFSPATDTASGSIRIAGTTRTIASGTALGGVMVGANVCLNASLNSVGEITSPTTVTVNSNPVPTVCGVLTAYSAATQTTAGNLVIGGIAYAIAPGITLGGESLIMTGANLCLSPVFTGSGQIGTGSVISSSTPNNCLQLPVPGITKGFTTGQDVFALPQPFFMTATSAVDANTRTFNISPATFGNTVVGLGGLPTLDPQGLSFSTPNGSLTLLSCLDSIWDVAFVIAGTGATTGDTVSIFLTSAGGIRTVVADFAIEPGGARLKTIHPGVRLFLDNRQANGTAVSVGTLLPFSNDAATAGRRTGLLLLNVLMDPGAPFNDCFQLGVNLTRGAGVGTTSLLIADVQLMRSELPGDRSRVGTGLRFGSTGGFPTGLICQAVCPSCPTDNVVQPPQVIKCSTICFYSPGFFLLNPGRMPTGGAVLVPGFNVNTPLSVGNNFSIINGVLQGNGLYGGTMTPAQRFAQQYVTAQMNLINGSGGGGIEADVLWAGLSCYGLDFTPITLSNGTTLSPESMLKDLFMQARFAATNQARTDADLNALSNLFARLNGQPEI